MFYLKFRNAIQANQLKIGWNYVSGGPETDDQSKLRFQVELEFVQCLANPNYLNCR